MFFQYRDYVFIISRNI